MWSTVRRVWECQHNDLHEVLPLGDLFIGLHQANVDILVDVRHFFPTKNAPESMDNLAAMIEECVAQGGRVQHNYVDSMSTPTTGDSKPW
jgi:hypothetical protein